MSDNSNKDTLPIKTEESKHGEADPSAGSDIPSEPPAGLSNKELKEWKKKEKASKRLAKKAQQSGQTVQEKEQEAILLKEKKQQQKLLQMQQEKIKQQKQKVKQEKEALAKQRKLEVQKQKMLSSSQKSNLFGHLETAQERKSSLLALSSVITSSKFGKITAQGLALPSLSYLTDKTVFQGTTSVGSKSVDHSEVIDISNSSDYLVNLSTILPSSVKKDLDTHTNELSSQIKDLIITKSLIHPSVLKLTDSYASYNIVGSTPRCLALIDAFKDLVFDYKTPQGTVLNRSLTQHLSHQIDFLIKSRPLSVSMGNFIRWFKQRISVLGINNDQNKAKSSGSDRLERKKTEDSLKLELIEDMETFKNEKILVAQQVIVNTASQHIQDGGCVITYGYSQVLFELFKHAKQVDKKNFKIIVIDSRPLFEGRRFVQDLQELGFTDVIYSLITSLGYIFDTMSIDCVLLGAHSILSNGFLNSRVGSASLAMSAKYHNIPVIVCCEALKFTNRVQLDSLTFNELADPNDLIDNTIEDAAHLGNNGSSLDGHVLDDSNIAKSDHGFQVGVCKNLYKNNLLDQFIREREQHLIEQQQKKDEMNQLNDKENGKNTNQQNNSSSSNNGTQQQNSGLSSINGSSQSDLKSKKQKNKKNKGINSWESNPSLNIFNIMYDLTPPSYISKIITEYGALPPQSVPVILRDYIK